MVNEQDQFAPPLDDKPLSADERTPVEFRAYDENGVLTHEGMHAVIAGGGSVLHRGTIYWRAQDLPKPEDLAEGNPHKLTEVAADLEARMAEIQARLDRVRAQNTGTPTHTPRLVGDNLPDGVRVGTPGEPGHGDTAGLGAEARTAGGDEGKDTTEKQATAKGK